MPVAIASFNTFVGSSNAAAEADIRALFDSGADAIGLQEMGSAGRDTMLRSIETTDCYIPTEPGAASTPIVWRTAKFTRLDSGVHKVSDRTYVGEAGAGPEYAKAKYVVWVKLRDNDTGRILFILNNHAVASVEGADGGPTHDHARRGRIELYRDHMAGLQSVIRDKGNEGIVFVTGDLNVNYRKDRIRRHPDFPYKRLEDVNTFASYRGLRSTPAGGTHDNRLIDYVAYRRVKAVDPRTQQIITHRPDGTAIASDHNSLLATFTLSANDKLTDTVTYPPISEAPPKGGDPGEPLPADTTGKYAEGRLGLLVVRGARLKANVAAAITSATLSMTTDQTTELNLELTDDADFSLLRSGLFAAGTPRSTGSRCDYDDLDLEVRAVEVAARGEGPTIRVTARALGVGRLKRRRGELIRKRLSPTRFVHLEAEAAGLRFVGQPSLERRNITRQTGRNAETSWDTCQRLAAELGYICFEAAGTLYFGQPTWLLERARRLDVRWNGAATKDDLDALPTCRRSGDDRRHVATVDAALRGDLGEKARPGMALVLDGVPGYAGRYLVNAITLDLMGDTAPVDVSAATAQDPKPEPPAENSPEAKTGKVSVPKPRAGLNIKGVRATTDQLANATTIYRVGRKMHVPAFGIRVALATAIQESVMRNLTGGDRDSVGLFQQRATWGSYATRHNPEEAAKLFFKALRKVNGWESLTLTAAAQAVQRSGHPGAYAQWADEARALMRAIIDTIPKDTTSSSTSKTASAFVAKALDQAGDHYIYGHEVDLKDPNPNTFDCSELVQWAAAQVGVRFVDGSAAQIARCKAISVDKGIHTRGALLYHPGHIAISLGNGKTIEAANSRAGVVSYNAAGRFTRAGLIPGMDYGK